jgi:hypothetical protein
VGIRRRWVLAGSNRHVQQYCWVDDCLQRLGAQHPVPRSSACNIAALNKGPSSTSKRHSGRALLKSGTDASDAVQAGGWPRGAPHSAPVPPAKHRDCPAAASNNPAQRPTTQLADCVCSTYHAAQRLLACWGGDTSDRGCAVAVLHGCSTYHLHAGQDSRALPRQGSAWEGTCKALNEGRGPFTPRGKPESSRLQHECLPTEVQSKL